MSDHRLRQISRQTAEALLRDTPALPDRSADNLTGLLAAASAPARDSELSGAESALAAFREARSVPHPAPRRTSILKTTLAKLLTVKVAAVLVATGAGGGLAVTAAATGHLPGPIAGPLGLHHSLPKTPELSFKNPALPAPAPATPKLPELCRTYLAHPGHDGRGEPHDRSFPILAKAAGGEAQVRTYCLKLAHEAATAPTPQPGSPSLPASPPSTPGHLPALPSGVPIPTLHPTLPSQPTLPTLPHPSGH